VTFDVGAEDVDLGVSEGNLLAVGLLHHNRTTKFADLRYGANRSDCNKKGNCKSSEKVFANH
jgi:hypothetical protein